MDSMVWPELTNLNVALPCFKFLFLLQNINLSFSTDFTQAHFNQQCIVFFSKLKHFGAGQGWRGEDKGIEGSAVFHDEEWVNFSDYFFSLKNSSF